MAKKRWKLLSLQESRLSCLMTVTPYLLYPKAENGIWSTWNAISRFLVEEQNKYASCLGSSQAIALDEPTLIGVSLVRCIHLSCVPMDLLHGWQVWFYHPETLFAFTLLVTRVQYIYVDVKIQTMKIVSQAWQLPCIFDVWTLLVWL